MHQGKFIWPGFGDNFRVIKWMMDRVKGRVPARETPIGFLPDYNDLNLSGLNISKEMFEKLFEFKAEEWKKEMEGIVEFYNRFGGRIPKELQDHLEKLKKSF